MKENQTKQDWYLGAKIECVQFVAVPKKSGSSEFKCASFISRLLEN